MTIYQFLRLFLLWVCLPHSYSPEIMFRRTPVPQQRILGTRVPRSDSKILHRQKRGWMWNQFFLLEEYTGSDYQYVGKVRPYWNGTYLHSYFIWLSKEYGWSSGWHSYKFDSQNAFIYIINILIWKTMNGHKIVNVEIHLVRINSAQ